MSEQKLTEIEEILIVAKSISHIENLNKISYEIFEKINDYNLSINDVKYVVEYMANTIFPDQRKEYNKSFEWPPFKVITKTF